MSADRPRHVQLGHKYSILPMLSAEFEATPSLFYAPHSRHAAATANADVRSLRTREERQPLLHGGNDMQRVYEEVTCFVDVAVGGVGVAVTTQVALAYTDGEDGFLARH